LKTKHLERTGRINLNRSFPIAAFGFAAAVSTVALVGCNYSASAELPSASSADRLSVIRIGYQKSNVLLNLIRVRKALEKRLKPGVEVVWQEFPAGPQLLEGLNVGSTDFGCTGEVPPVFSQAADAPLLYVLSERAGPATEAILVRGDSPLKSVSELKGKRVALNKASNVHFLLVRVLEHSGLTWADIEPVYLTPADARAAFESGRVDAWAIWDPYYAEVVGAGQARLLADGTGLVENRGYYLATRQFVNEQPEAFKILLAEVRAMSQWGDTHRDELADFYAQVLEMEPRVVRVAEHRRHFGMETMKPEIVAYQQQIADTFFRLGLIPHSVAVQDAVWNAGQK
jgi:sulfonate transport system substrate-binding protein